MLHASSSAGQWLTGWSAYDRRFLETLGLAPEDRLADGSISGLRSEPTFVRPRLRRCSLTLPEGKGIRGR